MTLEELSVRLSAATTATSKRWIDGTVITFHDDNRSFFAKVTKGDSAHLEVAVLENRRWIEATPKERALILFEIEIRGMGWN